MDQRSRNSYFGARCKNLVLYSGKSLFYQSSSCSTRGLYQPWTKLSRIPTSRKRLVWRNKRLRKQTSSFAEDRSLSWSTTTCGSLAWTILSSIMLTYFLLFFGLTIFRISIPDGTKCHCQWSNSHLMTSWKELYKLRIRESEKLKTVFELYNMEIHQKKAEPDYRVLNKM